MIETPATDSRLYEHLTLSNGLRCLLIEDTKAEKSAAALAVCVGQMQDDQLPGLAHLTEHLLFMGTHKYPDENGYDRFLSAAGGHSNAYTSLEKTVYYFDCQASSIEGALDRFSSCFICPLLSDKSIEREIQAVDSEHANHVSDDAWRLDHLSRTLLGSSENIHPYSNFGSGNRESLAVHGISKLRDAVQEFWERYYKASNMTLAVVGNDMTEIKRMVEQYFAETPVDLDGIQSRPSPLPALSPSLPLQVNVIPIREDITLELQWPMREIQSLYRSKPSHLLSHLIGHEGPGSLLACLREQHWAHELVTDDASKSCRDFSVFSLEIVLTPLGFENIHHIIALVFRYIELLHDIPEWVFDELKASSDMQFRFMSDRAPSDTASSLVVAMHHYPPSLTLSGPYKLFVAEHPRADVQQIMKYLTPTNVLVIVGAKEVKTDQVEKWYGTCYKCFPIEKTVLKLWEQPPAEIAVTLRLPDLNDMIATEFELVQPLDLYTEDPTPRCLMDTPTCRLWYKPDTVFLQPKVNLLILLRTTAVYEESPASSVLASLWVECLHEYANDFSYAASMAGLHCDFASSHAGLELHVSGYSHKAFVLVERILSKINSLSEFISDVVFDRITDKIRNQFASFFVAQPYQHAIYAADLCLEDARWSMQSLLSALDDLTRIDLLYFSSKVMKRFTIELLIHGNVTGQKALQLCEVLVKHWKPQPPLSLPACRVTRLESPSALYRFRGLNEQDNNSCVVNLYQVGQISIQSNAVLSLMHHLMREPAFNQLRTEEQLGYVVHTAIKTSGVNIKSWLCLIQSESFDPIHMDQRIEVFLYEFRRVLASMPVTDYSMNVESVCQNLLEKNKNLGEESSKYWSVISNQTYRFRRLEEIAAHVQTLTKEDVLCFYDRFIMAESPYRRKLCVQVFGKNHASVLTNSSGDTRENIDTTLVEHPEKFRQSQSLFPIPSSASLGDRLINISSST